MISLSKWFAWLGIIGLTIATIVPAEERPTTYLPHGFEHILAFAVVALFVGLSFKIRLPMLALLALLFAACLEALQIPLPTRHARIEDLVYNTVGAWLGLIIGTQLFSERFSEIFRR